MCSSDGTLRVTLMPVLGNEHRTIGASCCQCHRECSLVSTPSWLLAGIVMSSSSNLWCRKSSLPATKLCCCHSVTSTHDLQWHVMSMQWHSSCICAQRII